MTQSANDTPGDGSRDPRTVADLLEVVAGNDVDHALGDLERLIARLRAGADQAAAARDILRTAPPDVIRAALRLRAARIEANR